MGVIYFPLQKGHFGKLNIHVLPQKYFNVHVYINIYLVS